MSFRPLLLAAVLLGAVLVAGCTNDDTPDETTPTETTPTPTTVTTPTPVTIALTLKTPDVPSVVIVNESFNFTLNVTGEPTLESDHIGAHYDNTTHANPEGAYGSPCNHTTGTVPGFYNVSCRFASVGTFHLRGHVRTNQSGDIRNFWGDEHTITVRAPVGEYSLNLSDEPFTPVIPGQSFDFRITVEGPADASATVDAWFGKNSTTTPTTEAYGIQCDRDADGSVPGTIHVVCIVPENATSGAHYYRGHLQIKVGDKAYDFWSQESSIEVLTT